MAGGGVSRSLTGVWPPYLREAARRAHALQQLAGSGLGHRHTLAAQLLSLHEGAVISFSIAGEATAATAARAAAETLVTQAARQ